MILTVEILTTVVVSYFHDHVDFQDPYFMITVIYYCVDLRKTYIKTIVFSS